MEGLIRKFFATSNDFIHNQQHITPVGSQMGFFNNNVEAQMKKTEGEEQQGDFPDATLKYISQMLMEEEELETQRCMFRDAMALHATEKYFSAVLDGTVANNTCPPQDGFSWTCALTNSFSSSSSDEPCFGLSLPASVDASEERQGMDHSPPKGKRDHNSFSLSSDNNGPAGMMMRNNKHLASFCDEPETFDDFFLFTKCRDKKEEPREQSKGGGGRGRRGKKKNKQETKKEFVDFRGLLTQCAQSMGDYDIGTASETLKKIRQHATPQGTGMERVAFHLANALEARLNGRGTSIYTSPQGNVSAADILRALQMYLTASPFKMVTSMMANRCIAKLAGGGATRLHVIDFGIFYGFQWPSLIQALSTMPGGPPRLRITGIDFPQPGFRSAERVNATGLRLEKYCQRFNVPFEFNAIAKKWDTIELEELQLDREDDVVIVNCLDRMGNVPDETVVPNSPREIVLNLIKNINADVFVHGVVNGTYNAPYFGMRFRETLFHFSSLFDMLEETVPHEDNDRWLFEGTVLAREMLNVIACEGTERVDRPETYRQWQVRSLRAGLQPLPLDQEIVKGVREKVKSEYNKNFTMDEDGNWLLQGWKGKVLHAVSCWKPSN
ncbi:hypothetical protein DM860_006321 [Cuscuta australis]|uniref:Uncharacterized protein n=1 Tax=Cuscuta australis TaxID=267555 RepID=A0A328DKJ0_9ASTE|nr:hypothetical protein DM860_006321 [Cuscuta australis]